MGEGMGGSGPGMLREIKRRVRAGAMLPLGEGLQLERDFYAAWADGHRSDLSTLSGTAVLERNRTRCNPPHRK